MPHQDLVILFPIWACMALVTLDLTWIWCIWSSDSPLLDLVSLIPT